MILLSEEHGLYGVEVPRDAVIRKDSSGHWIEISSLTEGDKMFAPGNCQILGTVSADTIDFDCEPYLKQGCRYGGKRLHYMASKTSVNDAFLSLIESKTGKYFVNPYGEEPPKYTETEFGALEASIRHRVDNAKWQSAQQNLIQKMVILKKID